MAFWSTKAVPMVDSNARKQHIPIMAPLRAVSLDQIPTAGAVALLPTDTPLAKAAMQYMQNSLSEVPDVQIQRGEAEVDKNTRAIVWLDGSPGQIQLLDDLLAKYERIGWVQLPMAGINAYSSLLKKYPTKIWTSAKGAFSQPVAEHAFTLALALLRYLPMRIRATSWGYSQAMSLFNSNILILGAGGITLSLIAQLEPFSPTITILRRKAEPLEDEVVPAKLKERISVSTLNDLDKHLPQADIVFVACAMTPDTRGCFAKSQFDKMQKHSILVNVARGEIINTDDLISALREGQIGGAGLDVTDPEPLPDGHPLWTLTTKHENMNVEEEKGGKRANLIIVSGVRKPSVIKSPGSIICQYPDRPLTPLTQLSRLYHSSLNGSPGTQKRLYWATDVLRVYVTQKLVISMQPLTLTIGQLESKRNRENPE